MSVNTKGVRYRRYSILNSKYRINPETGETNIKVKSVSMGKWVKIDNALSLIFPCIVPSLDDAKLLLHSKEIDRAVYKDGNQTLFSVPSIMLHIKNANAIKFKKEGNKSSTAKYLVNLQEDLSGIPVRSTDHVFDRLSMFKTAMDFTFSPNNKDGAMGAYNTYRSLFGTMMFRPFIDKSFKKMHSLSERELKSILFLAPIRFFSRGDIFNAEGMLSASNTKLIPELIKSGLIRLYRSDDNAYKEIYTITTKGIKLAREYADYTLFKKKMPMTKAVGSPRMDIPSLKGRYNKTSGFNRLYTYYTYAFEVVNTTETENVLGYREEEIDEFFRGGNELAMFSPFMYVKMNLLFSQGKLNSKDTVLFMKRKLAVDIFAESGFKFKYSPKFNRKKLESMSEVEGTEAQEILDELWKLNDENARIQDHFYLPVGNKTLRQREVYLLEKDLFERERQLSIRLSELKNGSSEEEDEDLFIN